MKLLLISGHDLKFINNIIHQLKDYYNILVDKWTGHNKHNINKSKELLNKADIILCEWCLGNAVFYSNNKMPHQKLLIRLHRVESKTDYIKKLNTKNIDSILYVSPSWNIISSLEYKFNLIKKVYYFKNDLSDVFKPNYNKIKININNNKISIGMCGILPFELKNPLKVLEIIKILKEKYEITFYLFGKKPSELAWIVKSDPQAIKKYSIFEKYLNKNTNYINIGFINNDELYNYFTKLDFILVTSNDESFHKSSLEALMAGVIPIFYGDYVNKYYCKFNWLNDFCFETTEDVIKYIDYITNINDKLVYLKPIIDKYWNYYNSNTIAKKLVNYMEYNIKNNKKFLLICLNSNLNYMDGSITFMNNLIKTLYTDFNIILILPHQKFIYKNKKDYFNFIYHYHILNINEKVEDIILKYNISFEIHKIFIRGFNIKYFQYFSNNIAKKTYHYLINNNNNRDDRVTYITQTDIMKSKYSNYNIKFILYPTCNVVKEQNYKKSSDKINIAYTGTIRKEFMSLELLKLMYELSKYANFVITIIISKLHIIGDYKTKIEELLKKFESKNNVNIYRKLPYEKTIEILKTVDYGFNFKNTSSDQKGEISTKIIEYINYNIKPIINESSDEIIFFNSKYPFLISNSQYNTESLKQNILKYKNHNIKDYINSIEFSKYSYENYKKTLYNIFS